MRAALGEPARLSRPEPGESRLAKGGENAEWRDRGENRRGDAGETREVERQRSGREGREGTHIKGSWMRAACGLRVFSGWHVPACWPQGMCGWGGGWGVFGGNVVVARTFLSTWRSLETLTLLLLAV